MTRTLLRAAVPAALLLLAGCATTAHSPLETSALDEVASHRVAKPLSLAECHALGGAHLCARGARLDSSQECTCISRDVLYDNRAVRSLLGTY